MISISAALTLLLYIVVGGLIFWLLFWLVGYIGLPAPFDKVARAILAILAVFILCGLLLSLLGGQPLFRP